MNVSILIGLTRKNTYDLELFHVFLLISSHHSVPSVLGAHVLCITERICAQRSTFHGLMAFLFADAALLSRFVRAVACTVSCLFADAASTSKGALDFGVGAVCLAVTDLATVETLSRLFTWLRAVASKVASLAAARYDVSDYP
jgi:hypothetical protein